MIDIYEFINSRDIREYLRDNDYHFDSLQAAYLVWQSKRHTIKEKHAAWNEIIMSYPDMPFPKYQGWGPEWKSLHQFLRDYMELEHKYLDRFMQFESNAVYESRDLDDELLWHNNYITQDFHTALSYEKKYMDLQRIDEIRFRIIKTYFDYEVDGYGGSIYVYFNGSGDPMGIWLILSEGEEKDIDSVMTPYLSKNEADLWHYSFEGLWFDIPTPFAKGDIVCDCIHQDPFVLTDLNTWEWQRVHFDETKNVRDNSDMIGYGYALDDISGSIYGSHTSEYLNLEFYREPLRGQKRILEAYSDYEKGKIDGVTLVDLVRLYEAEDAVEDAKQQLGAYFYAKEKESSKDSKLEREGE